MREIIAYLDLKAVRTQQLNKTDPAPYATAFELSEQLDALMPCVCRSLSILKNQGRIRVFPRKSPERRNRRYGSMILPRVDYDELVKEMKRGATPILMSLRYSKS